MMLGLIPEQTKAISEMVRVLRPNGILALCTHGPEYYREAIETGLRVMTARYFLGYRFEYWPRTEIEINNMLQKNKLKNVRTERVTWTDRFDSGTDTFEFYAATTSLWWYAQIPADFRENETAKTRKTFDLEGVTQITSDVVFAYGRKA